MKNLFSTSRTMKGALVAFTFLLFSSLSFSQSPLVVQDASGPNACDGWAYLDSTVATLPITWMGSGSGAVLGTDSYSVIDLCPGEYVVTFSSNSPNGGSITMTFIIGGNGNTNPCLGFLAAMNTTDTDLNACNGTASVTVTGGTAPYTYVWSNPISPNANLNYVNDLCPGNYSVYITDANGCGTNASGIVSENNSGGGPNPTDTIIVIINNTFPPNSVTDSLPTVTILDCDIVFDSIASAAITNVQANNSGVTVTWTIYDITGGVMATYEIPYYNVVTNPSGAVYQATLILMCGRSIQGVQITDQFEYTPGSANILENSGIELHIVNPMYDNLLVQFNGNFEGKLTLIDLNGSLIFSQNVNANSFEYNVSDLSKGMYVLQIESTTGVSAVKLMK